VTEKHNGQLKLYSQPGYGATFEILLPVAWGDRTAR
jgi:signal transduction histidine kinase